VILDELLARGEAMHQALGREWYRAGAGLTMDPQFTAIYEQFDDLQHDDALTVAMESGDPALVEWIVDVRVSRRLAAFEERQLAWEHEAVVEAGGTSLPYLRVPIEIANEADRDRRIALDRARGRVTADGLVPIRRERFALERELLLAHSGHDDYVRALGDFAGIDLDALGAAARTFLDDTADMYEDSLARLVRRYLGTGLGGLERSDALWLFRIDRYDAGFPPAAMVDVATTQMAAMGLDALKGGRVRIDTEDREGKQPRAFCVPVRVPDEVYLVLRPSGGHGDYRTFWHELGHAMHFASVEAAMPFAARWLGDNSVTEGFAMLWDHLTIDPRWLRRYAQLDGGARDELVFELAVSELFMARRYAAKLNYELEFHRTSPEQVASRYAEWLTEATRFRYPEDDALIDVDPGFYAARYLRAWQLEATLAGTLTNRFDEEWFRRPEAGAFVGELMARGQATPADRLAQDVTGTPLGFDAVAARLETALA
jgi:hypothetical protein